MTLITLNISRSGTLTLLAFLMLSLTTNSFGQQKPTALKLDVDSDDKVLCASSSISSSEFCDLYRTYSRSGVTMDAKLSARNEMIELVRGQVDTYFSERTEGRKKKVKWFQTLFDFLEIGAATAIGVMNGERAKSVVGIALGGFQAERTALTKNFEILQTQVLINKMKANRAEIMVTILNGKQRSTDDYSWYSAKNDLRRLLLSGTFNDALDSLVNQTGAEASHAEKMLEIVAARPLVPPAPKEFLPVSRDARTVKDRIRDDLASGDTARISAATDKLHVIVKELEQDDAIKGRLPGKGIASSVADGQKLFDDLQLLIEELPETDGAAGREMVNRINQAFIRNK